MGVTRYKPHPVTYQKTTHAGDVYPTHWFQHIADSEGPEKRYLWYTNAQYLIKLQSITSIASEIFISRLGELMQVPTVHNDMAYIMRGDYTTNLVTTSVKEKMDGYTLDDPSAYIWRADHEPRRVLYDFSINEDDYDGIELYQLKKLLGRYFHRTSSQFKDDFVGFNFFSEFIRQEDHAELNNVPVWIPRDAPLASEQYIMGGAYDFAACETFDAACALFDGKVDEEKFAKIFNKFINPKNLLWAIKNHPKATQEFMDKLDSLQGSGLDKICNISALNDFTKGHTDGQILYTELTGSALAEGFRIRAKALQEQFARAKKGVGKSI